MQGIQKFICSVVVVLGLLLSPINQGISTASAESVKDVEARAYLQSVYEAMADMKNVHMDMVMDADTPLGQVAATMDMDIQDKPMVCKNDMKFSFKNKMNMNSEFAMTQYMEQVEKNLITYTLLNGEWVKQTVPFNESSSLKESPAVRVQNAMQMVKSVAVKEDTVSYKELAVVLDNQKLSDLLDKILKQEEMKTLKKEEQQKVLQIMQTAVKAMGDFDYTIHVDKSNKMITSMTMDLTQPVRNSAKAVIDTMPNMDEKNKAQIQTFLEKTTLKVKGEYSNFNQVKEIKVPKEVRKTAKELKMNEKNTAAEGAQL